MNFVGKLVLRNKVYNDFIIIGYKTSTKLSLCMSPAVPFLSYPIYILLIHLHAYSRSYCLSCHVFRYGDLSRFF